MRVAAAYNYRDIPDFPDACELCDLRPPLGRTTEVRTSDTVTVGILLKIHMVYSEWPLNILV